MTRCLSAFLLLVAPFGTVINADAQARRTAPVPLTQEVSAAAGQVHGIVTDQSGAGLGDVSVLAMGTTLAAVRSGVDGRFSLILPQGEYILRATRQGYVSTFREPVRVRSEQAIERNIRLIRADASSAVPRSAVPAPVDTVNPTVDPPATPDDHSHSEAVWRLRHLPRTVLRDAARSTSIWTRDEDAGWPRPASGVDSFLVNSARAAASFFTDTNFDGQVNLLTTSARASRGTEVGGNDVWARGVAYFAVSAPVGSYGDWSLRASTASSNLSAWTLVANYDAEASRTHAFHLGLSYGSQRLVLEEARPIPGFVPEARGVSGLFLSDRWRVRPELEVEYGLRLDHYNYLRDHAAVSPHVQARVRVAPRTHVRVAAARRVRAPGADQFLPATGSRAWLPPERTFSSLLAEAPLRAERVHEYDAGLDYALGAAERTTVHLRRFSQSTSRQLATLFGLDETSAVGHYYAATLGRVRVDGWSVGVGGELAPGLRGGVDYVLADAYWIRFSRFRLDQVAPSVARRDRERLHDLSGTLAWSLDDPGTHVELQYRLSNAFSAASASDIKPAAGGRFNLDVRQALPYRPFGQASINLLFSVRSLLYDEWDTGAFYDELLTVAPPTRLTGGLQVWF